MGPASSLHASAYYSEYNEKFDLMCVRKAFNDDEFDFAERKSLNILQSNVHKNKFYEKNINLSQRYCLVIYAANIALLLQRN